MLVNAIFSCDCRCCFSGSWRLDAGDWTSLVCLNHSFMTNCLELMIGLTVRSFSPAALDTDLSPDEAEEKERLIQQVLELQNTLGGR